MSTWIHWILIGLVLCALAFGVWYTFAGGGPTIRAGKANVASLRQQLAAAQGRGDANAIAALSRQLDTAVGQQAAAGDPTADPIGDNVATCASSFDLIDPILADISATNRADWLARGNKWGNAVHLGTNAKDCLTNAAERATTVGDLQKVRAAIISWGTKMRATQNRLYAASHGGEAGLDAYSGSPEPGGDDKAHAWLVGIVDPLWELLAGVDRRILALTPTDAGVTAESAVFTAHPTSFDHSIFGA